MLSLTYLIIISIISLTTQQLYHIISAPIRDVGNLSKESNVTEIAGFNNVTQAANIKGINGLINLTQLSEPSELSFMNASNILNKNNTKNFTLTTKCFEDIGCITSDDFFDTLKTLPLVFTDPQEMNVTYNLFTRQNRNNGQVFTYKPNNKSIKESQFSAERKTKIIIHGYMSGFSGHNWMSKIKDYLLNVSDYNVFAIDWSKGADSVNYFQSAANTRVVGAMTAYFINRLINATNAKASDVHCIGHSLGAQTCGHFGQRLKNPKLGQISGLDPAGPAFLLNDTNTRLDASDANLVLIIHTNAGVFTSEGTIPVEVTGILGNNNNLGHYDFWPNGGSKQPGCGLVDKVLNITQNPKDLLSVPTCNHERAHGYPISLNKNNCQFIAYECNSYAEFEEGKCGDCGANGQMCKPMEFEFGFWENNAILSESQKQRTNSKNLYLKTNDSQPYCLFHYQILVHIMDNSSSARGELEISLTPQKKVSIKRSLTSETGQDLSFKPGHNYTQLYLDSQDLGPVVNTTLKWSSLLRNKIKIDKIFINFLSHNNKRVRESKSTKLCRNGNNDISNGNSVVFRECE